MCRAVFAVNGVPAAPLPSLENAVLPPQVCVEAPVPEYRADQHKAARIAWNTHED